jgi:putative transposase
LENLGGSYTWGMPRPPLFFRLTPLDAAALEALLQGGVQPVRVVLRALALLALDRGESAPTVSALVRFSPQAVRNIAQRYRAEGLEGALYERPRPGAAEVLAPAEKQRIIAMVCADPPAGAARWTVRLITEQAVKRKLVDQVGRETIRMLLQSHDLKPWREKNVVSRDP